MTIHQKIGKKIRMARKSLGMTQSELAKSLGKTGAAVAYLEQGKRRISTDVLTTISEVTGKPLAYFYEDEHDSDARLKKQLTDLRTHLDGIKSLLDEAEKEKVVKNQEILLFRAVLDQSSDAIVVWDPETGRALDCNEKACSAMGYTREEFLQKTIMEVESGIPTIDIWRDCVRVAQKNKNYILHTFPRNKDGELTPVEVSVNYVVVEDKPYIVGMARFLNERKHHLAIAEEKIRRSRVLVDNTLGVFFTDITGMLTEVNSVLWDSMQVPASLRTENDFSLIQQAFEASGIDTFIQECLRGKQEMSQEFRFIPSWKDPLEIQVKLVPIHHLSYLLGVQGVVEKVKKKGSRG
ncbi:MAG: PAS domain S-box protein [Candidatus Altimarinota bacterium]